jgi:HPt (histidine-containing phosphotransfer) domain-containing protein
MEQEDTTTGMRQSGPDRFDETYVNAEQGLKILGNNAKLYVRLLESFAGNGLVPEFVAAVKSGDLKLSQLKAHTVKGVSANLSLAALCKLFEELDKELKAGRMPEPESPEMKEVQETYEQTLSAIKAIAANPALITKGK